MHFADLEQSITAEEQSFPHLLGDVSKRLRTLQVRADGATLHLGGGFLFAAPAELVYQPAFFTLHLDTCLPC